MLTHVGNSSRENLALGKKVTETYYFSQAPNMFLFIPNLSKPQSLIDIKGKSSSASLRQYAIAGTWFAQNVFVPLTAYLLVRGNTSLAVTTRHNKILSPTALEHLAVTIKLEY